MTKKPRGGITTLHASTPLHATATYQPRQLRGPVPRSRFYRDAFEHRWFLCSVWDDNEVMFGDSLEFYGPRPAPGPVHRRVHIKQENR